MVIVMNNNVHTLWVGGPLTPTVVGNLMKMPSGHPAMKDAYEATCRSVGADNRDWNRPIRLLSAAGAASPI